MNNILYRFLPMKEYAFSSLINEELYASFSETFNDPYDTFLSYNVDQVYTTIMNNRKLSLYFFHNYCYKYIGYYELYSSYDEFDKAERLIWSKYINEEYKEDIYNAINKEASQILNNIKNKVVMTCFSETLLNETMWSHYSSRGEGFVLAYDMNILSATKDQYINKLYRSYSNQDYCNLFGLLPVNYKNEKIDKTSFVIDKLKLKSLKKNKHYDIDERDFKIFNSSKITNANEIISFYLTKNNTWNYEKEYRLVLPYDASDYLFFSKISDDLNHNQHILIGKCKPSAIYAGEFMKLSSLIFLCYIAKEKNIPIYRMKTPSSSLSKGLTPILMDEALIDYYLSIPRSI